MTVMNDSYISTMSINEIIGERVSIWLRRRGLMQMDLANYLGLKKPVVSRKISGHVAWSAIDLVRTAAFLDLNIEDLLPNETVELEKAKSLDSVESRDSGLVAGPGFEPGTSGL